MKFEFPDKGNVSVSNAGEAYGSIHFTANIDYTTERGRILLSPNCLKLTDEATIPTFDNPVGSFAVYDNRWWGFSDVVLRGASNSADTPATGWAIDGTAGSPTLDWDESDSVVFNNLLLVSGVSGGGDIYAYNGTTWSSWWTGTLTQSALSTSNYKALEVGPNGRLYIIDSGNKVYNVTTAGTVTKTGNGTLDFSASNYKFFNMVMSSTRMWMGGMDTVTGDSVVVEWDMSLNEATANKIHKPGGHGVCTIVIWNDSPVLLLSDGTLRFFNGYSFESADGAKLPEPPFGSSYDGDEIGNVIPLPSELIAHSNGSCIIDGLPHFLIKTNLRTAAGNTGAVTPQIYSGVYCYDPNVGLYLRFPIEPNGGTSGFGASLPSDVGAMVSATSRSTKFLASARFSDNTNQNAVVFSDDRARTLASRGRFALNPFYGSGRDLWQKCEVLASNLKDSSDRILLKYRIKKSIDLPNEITSVTWVSSTQFTSTDTDFANVVAGDWVLVMRGNGAGCTAHVSSISYSNPTYTVTLDESITGVSASDTGRVIVDNWKRLATFSNQKTDYHDISIPPTESGHTFWLMVELRAVAGSMVELDKIIVTPKG